ncbi:ABC transporter substrate-binding protein [Actinomycetospora cinnamomea]|uniref:Amino acid/amide ABC transporter substrate-binding protein (HAAT family) n=1 Tax=Actinomycetospora cinnamomea TaxID=663609 RepID=A0A2U1ECR1_9PSEU|nr:ABC transporter substrate-binding protein [Actinomycetospora cinnamomea]PVY97489.1 amino acid/amide ABC transporter substrate-binding protein (HAAT family) [Actinomycetospora cinnamomea]
MRVRPGAAATRIAAVAAVLAMVLAGCGAGGRSEDPGGASDVGVTPTSIKVGAHFPLTGVAAPGYSEIPTGTRAYFDWVNANGGVNGRQIEYIFRDDAYTPTQTTQVVNELVLRDQVFAVTGGLGTATHGAVLDFLNSEGVPDLFASSGSLLWNQPEQNPMTFGWQPDYEVEGKILGQYIAQTYPNARVGLLLQDDDFGRDGEVGVRRTLNTQIVSVARYTSGATDITPQVSQLQAQGADLVIGFTVPSYTARSQLAAQQLNYRPQWAYSNVGSDPTLVGGLLQRLSQGQSGPNPLEGVLTTKYLPGPEETNDPWVQLFSQVWAAHGDGGPLTSFRIYGMSEAYTFVQALQAAGPAPTRQGLVDAVERQGGGPDGFRGPAYPPFRYGPDSHAGMAGVAVARLQGGSTVPLTPVRLTDNGDAPITDAPAQERPAPPPQGIPTVVPTGS